MCKTMIKIFFRVFVIIFGILPMNWLASTNNVKAASTQDTVLAQAELPALISITFDDEDLSVYDSGFPILQAQGLPATFYFITEFLNTQWITRLNDLQDHGWEIGSHSVTHPYLDIINYTQLVYEISQSKQSLQDAGLNVTGFAYPYGVMGSDSTIRNLVMQYYAYARSTDPGYNTPDSDQYALLVHFYTSETTLSEAKGWIDTAIAQKKWLVLGLHYVDNTGANYSISPADLTELASYIKTRENAGAIQAATMQDAYDIYLSGTPGTSPRITDVAADPLETEAVITWTTNEPASSIVEYGLTSSYGSATPEADTFPRVYDHSVTITGLDTCTTYHYRAQSRDTDGEEGTSGDFTFTTNGCISHSPEITSVVATPSTNQAVITWTTNEPASSIVEYGLTIPYDYALPEADTSPRVTDHTVTVSSLTACTTYHYRVRSKDADGEEGNSPDLTFTTVGCTPPTITNVVAAPTPTQAVITWETNTPASSIVDYGLTTPYAYATSEMDISPRVTSHSVILEYLSPCTTYHYRVRSRDENGSEGVSTDFTFTTTGCSVHPPVITDVVATPSSTQAIITWSTDEPASSIVKFGLTIPYDYAMPEMDTSPRVTSHSVTLEYLTACTTYHYQVLSRDADSEEGTSDDFTFTTTGCSVHPPEITNVVATPSSTHAVITWTTDEPASSIVEFGLTVPYDYAMPEMDTSPRVTSHSVTLEYLTACTTYHYRVRSRDADGEEGNSPDLTFTTIGCTPPTITNVAAAPTSTQAVITWATDEAASSIVDYGLTLPYDYATSETDTSPRVTEHTVTVSGLTACTTYHYRVRSRDADGEEGTSGDLTFATTGCTPPIITNVVATPSTNQAVIAWATDEAASSIVDYGLTLPYDYATSETDTSPRVTEHTVTVSGLTACTTYHYRVRSRDADGEEGYSQDLTFATTGCTPPTITNVAAAPTSTQAVITWTTDEAASSIVDFGLTLPYDYATPETDTSPRVTSHSVTLEYLSTCTTYHYQARSRDADGEEGASSDFVFTTTGCDTTPPTITNVAANPSDTQAVFTWTTNEGASSIVDYGLTTSYRTTTPEADTSPRVTSHSVTVTGLTACTAYHYLVRSRDAALNEGAGSDLTFTTTGCDTTPPAITNVIANPSDTQAVITWTTNESASSIADYGLTTSYGITTPEADTSPRVTSHSVTVTNLTVCTTYHYRVRSKDAALNEGAGSDLTFTTTGCDTTPPTISNVDATPSTNQAVISWTTDEPASSIVDYGLTTSYGSTIPEEDTSPRVTNHSVSVADLTVCTTYHYQVRSKDAALNEGASDDFTFTTTGCDTTLPTISDVNATPSNTQTVITWTTDETATTIVDYGLTTAYGTTTTEADTLPRVSSHSVTVTELNVCTTYHYRVRSRDAALNEGVSGDHTFTTTGCDTTPPTISNVDATPSSTQAVITWTTDEPASSIVKYGLTTSYGTSTVEADTAPRVISHSVTVTGLAACTTHHYQVSSRDAALNEDESDDLTFTTTGCDITPPTISTVVATPSSTQAVITWTTNEVASSIVDYGLTTSYGTSTPEADTAPRVTSHSVTVTNLTVCTTYHYRVRSKDAALNEGESDDLTFTTTGCDTTPPTISTVIATPSNTQAVITWTTDDVASSIVDYGLTTTYGITTPEADTSPRVTNHSVTVTGLTACTAYHYRVRSRDAALNEGASGDLTFITTGCDTTPPVISNVVATPSTNQAVITWTTDDVASSIVDYGLTTSYGITTPEADTSPRVTSHSVTVTGLTACTTYHYRVRSRDAALNEGVGSDHTFTTTGCDTTPPMIFNINANPLSTQVVIQWMTNEAASSAVQYGLSTSYGTETPETDITPRVRNHLVTITSLTACTTYHFRVRSRDAALNLASSRDLTFKTTGCAPNPPAITSVRAVPSSTTTVITWRTNTATSSIVDYGLTSSYGTTTNETNISPRVTSHTVMLRSLTACTIYHYRVRSRDRYGVEGTSTDFTFKTAGCQ